jgi:hypothetical protein
VSLESFAEARQRPGPPCTVCGIFGRQPDLAAEVRTDRKRPAPHTYRVIAAYLTHLAGIPVTMNKVRDHFYAHEGGA